MREHLDFDDASEHRCFDAGIRRFLGGHDPIIYPEHWDDVLINRGWHYAERQKTKYGSEITHV